MSDFSDKEEEIRDQEIAAGDDGVNDWHMSDPIPDDNKTTETPNMSNAEKQQAAGALLGIFFLPLYKIKNVTTRFDTICIKLTK